MSSIALRVTAGLVTCSVLCGSLVGQSKAADYYWSYYAPGYCHGAAPVEWVSVWSPVFYDACPVVMAPAPCMPSPATTAPTYATPQPAPPSSTGPAPAPAKAAPKVSESRSFYYAPDVSISNSARASGDAVTVTFWNLSEQDLALLIEGRAHVIGRGQSVRADVPRQFLWRVEGRVAQAERIPDEQRSMEIVIRQ